MQLTLAERLTEDRKLIIVRRCNPYPSIFPGELSHKTAGESVDEEHLKAHELDKERLKLAKSIHEERLSNSTLDAYQMPENYDDDQSKRLAIVKARIAQTDSVQNRRPVTDLQLWEAQQTQAGLLKSTPSTAANARAAKLLDERGNEIDFVLDPSASMLSHHNEGDGTISHQSSSGGSSKCSFFDRLVE